MPDLIEAEKTYRQMQLDALSKGKPVPFLFGCMDSERGIRQRASELGLCATPEPQPTRADLDGYFGELERQMQEI